MNGPTGFNVRYRKSAGYALVQLPVRPSTIVSANFVAQALLDAGATTVEIWHSGELLHDTTSLELRR